MSKINNRHMSALCGSRCLEFIVRPVADNTACGTVQGALKGLAGKIML
jgi:hypothetical protein